MFPTLLIITQENGNYCERKGCLDLVWTLAELCENFHSLFYRDRYADSTCNWNTSRNFFLKNFIADALSWNKEEDFVLLCKQV